MITNHGLNRGSNASNEWYTADGHRNGLTTILTKSARKIFYNRFDGLLARCTIFDLSLNRIVSDESVTNGGIYDLTYKNGIYILQPRGYRFFDLLVLMIFY